MTRTVTEADFRKPEFIDAKVEDYEFDDDGKLVRKDRWKTAIWDIKRIVDPDSRSFEIADIVAKVQELWNNVYGFVEADTPEWNFNQTLRSWSIRDLQEEFPTGTSVKILLSSGNAENCIVRWFSDNCVLTPTTRCNTEYYYSDIQNGTISAIRKN